MSLKLDCAKKETDVFEGYDLEVEEELRSHATKMTTTGEDLTTISF